MPGADGALVQMNYRHALDSVEGLTDPKDLDARLERADLTGNAALARAVAYRANETGDTRTVTKYLDTDGDARKAYQEWANAHEDLQRLESYGAELAFGYAEAEEPREMRTPETRAEMTGAMPRKACPACVHPEWATIDRALVEHDQAPRSIVRRYRGLSRRAVERHRDRCLSAVGEGGDGS